MPASLGRSILSGDSMCRNSRQVRSTQEVGRAISRLRDPPEVVQRALGESIKLARKRLQVIFFWERRGACWLLGV